SDIFSKVVGEFMGIEFLLFAPCIVMACVEVVGMRIGEDCHDHLRSDRAPGVTYRCPEVCTTGCADRLIEQGTEVSGAGDAGGVGRLDYEVDAFGIERLRQHGSAYAFDTSRHPGAVAFDAVEPTGKVGGVLCIHTGDLVVKA